MNKKRKDTKPLVVGGEDMIRMLNSVSLSTLENILEDLGQPDFTNAGIVNTVKLIKSSRIKRIEFANYDTLVDDMEEWHDY